VRNFVGWFLSPISNPSGSTTFLIVARFFFFSFAQNKTRSSLERPYFTSLLPTTEESRKHEDSRTQTSFNIGIQAGVEP
jgi:hypothetical protein